MVAGVRPSDADGAEGADGADGEMVPAEAEPTGTRVVLLDTGYGATGTAALLSVTMDAAVPVLSMADGTVLRMTAGAVLRMTDGAVLRMTAGWEELATTTGAAEMIGVTIGATGVEETATGVAAVATTGYDLVQGQSLIVNVVACRGNLSAIARTIDRPAIKRSTPSLPRSQCEPCR